MIAYTKTTGWLIVYLGSVRIYIPYFDLASG